jgi:uncharacterized protein YdhG (YjbR/CyaY superfamily)
MVGREIALPAATSEPCVKRNAPFTRLFSQRVFVIDAMLQREFRHAGGKMRTKRKAPKNIDDYIAGFPPDVQEILEKIRATIHKAAPGAEERISYQIPTFTLKGQYVIYFAAFSKHVSVYPAPRGAAEFKETLSAYEGGKGTVRFPLDKRIPFGLISKIVKYRMKEAGKKVEAERTKR